jgi:hypothetical protein
MPPPPADVIWREKLEKKDREKREKCQKRKKLERTRNLELKGLNR